MEGNKVQEITNVLENVMNTVLSVDSVSIENYVENLRNQYPGISNDDLALKILNKKSFQNGLVGAVSGLGGVLTLPVSIPANLTMTWRLQATMAFSIAYVYGYTPENSDLKTDLYLILAGDSAKEVLKKLGIEASKSIAKKAVEKYITKKVMQKIWKVLGQKIITKAGEKSLTSFTKLVPGVGAPVGFIFDWAATKAIGKIAISYYKN